MQPSQSSFTRRVLDTLPPGLSLEVDFVLSRPVPVPKVNPEVNREVKIERDGLFLATLRENLHAAALHAALGHTGPSFRECHGPACIEATKLIPELNPLHPAATDDELDAILDEVLTSLERAGIPLFAAQPS